MAAQVAALREEAETGNGSCSTSHSEIACDNDGDDLNHSPSSFLYAKRSWLSVEGGEVFDGLFTGVPIKQGTVITLYIGEIYRTAEALKVPDKSYLMRLGEQCYIDARVQGPDGGPPCIARYINDCINPAGINVRFDKMPTAQPHPCAHVVALRSIAAGEELFVDYGKWYWTGAPIKPVRIPFMQLHLLRAAATKAASASMESIEGEG